MTSHPPRNRYRFFPDVSYLGTDRKEKLDVYLPSASGKDPIPAVLLIHGGGWRTGDKASDREKNIGSTLASHGYAVFSINYELNQSHKNPKTGRLRLTRLAWPQNLYDCKSALRFLRVRAKEYGLDPRRIAVMGGSAGGHLAMLLAATSSNVEINRHGLYTDQSNDVSCVLNFYGEYDVRGRKVSPFSGGIRKRTAGLEASASPVTYFNSKLPPMFITHGTADRIIPVERSRELAGYLEKIGRPYWYVEIGGAPHTYDLQPEAMDLRPVVLSFLEKYLTNSLSQTVPRRKAQRFL